MTKDENKLLKAMKARKISMNRKMDKITSDLCVMKIEIKHIDYEIITMERTDGSVKEEHKDRNNNNLKNGDQVRILTGTTKAKKKSTGIFLGVRGDFANVRVTDTSKKKRNNHTANDEKFDLYHSYTS